MLIVGNSLKDFRIYKNATKYEFHYNDNKECIGLSIINADNTADFIPKKYLPVQFICNKQKFEDLFNVELKED